MTHDRDPRRQLTLHDRLWGAQEQLHQLARRLERPGPHGAQYASDVYDLLGALTVATRDIADITHRATRLLPDASDHNLTTRPLTDADHTHLDHAHHAARSLVEALGHAQTAINDIGGHLTPRRPRQPGPAARQTDRDAPPPATRPRTPPPQGRRR